MNAHRHRLIFNRARGLFMAVAEIASARGKSPGQTPVEASAAPSPTVHLARLRPTAAFTTLALLALGAQVACLPLAEAQIVAYRAAPASQQPTVLSAGNGVPLINIQTPSAAGVSRNTYEQFDVQTQGVILNNARNNAPTQLGGWVQGNPWLATGSARIILNEVVSANPSQLLGYVEVAGSAAQVVVANPAGVTCNGCGFINASRATLTTGTPIVSGGNLEGYRVEGGTIRIEGAGMDASRVGYTDLIARAVEVNAGLWAQTLKVTAGSNVVDADHTQATPITGSGAAPAFAIDVAQLGGMYAGKITLVGTEAGVGVRNAGTLGASAGEVVVTADGRLTNSGSVMARGDIALTTPGEIQNTGLVSAGGTLSVAAARVTNANTLGASQGLEGQALTINAGTIDNHSGALRANAALTITSSDNLDNSGGLISSAQTINVRDAAASKTLAITNTAGTFIADQRLDIDSASITGDGKLLSQGDLAVKVVADYTHAGEFLANGRASLETAGTLTNQATMQAGTVLTLTAATLDNRAAGQIIAPELTLAATGTHTLTNRGLIDGGDTRLDAVTLNNLGTGRIYGNHLAIAATTLNNAAETVDGVTSAPVIAARNRLDLAVGTLNNREGALIFSAGDMAIGGTLDGANRATGQAGTVNNASATIEALSNLTLNAATINNTNEHFSTQLVAVGSVLMDEWAISGGARYRPDEVTLSWTSAPGVTYYPAPTDGRSWMGSQGFFSDNSNNYVFLHTPSGTSGNFWVYTFTRSTQESQVQTSSPGKITAGGDMAISATTLNNDNSHILAGGNLAGSFGSVLNTATPGQRIVTDSGTAWNIYQDTSHDDSDGNSYAYNPGPSISAISLSAARLQGNTVPGGSGTTLGALNIGNLAQRAAGSGSLFNPNTSPTATYFIETDPRFANYRQWLSSDYMLKALALDPATTQKRLGDGFYEQRLITEQVAQLTGRRFLVGYANEEDQYRALMTAGVAFAKEWQLIPGVALTSEQMARLTTDMVWLVEKEVTLADGRTQKALVPQLYARIKDGDLAPTGGLLADKALDLQVQGKLTNLGTLAGRQLVSLTAENLQNLGGRITGEEVWLTARQDLQNLGGKIDAGNRLDLYAGRNIDITSTVRSEGSQTSLDRLAGLYVQNPGGIMKLAAAGDLSLIAAQLQSAGTTRIEAGNNLTLGTVTTAWANSVGNGKNGRQESGSREVGTMIQSSGDLTLAAGNDLTARAADVTSEKGALVASAGNDLRIEAGESTLNVAEQHKTTSKGFLSKTTTTTRDTLNDIDAIASTLSGDTTTLIADRDIAIKGSNVVATNDTTLSAGRNLTIEAATETHNETHFTSEKKSGLFTSGLKSTNKTNEALNAQGSVVSAGRDLSLMAGIQAAPGEDAAQQNPLRGNLTLQGSALDAGRDLSIQTSGDLQLLAAYSQSRETTQRTKQTSKKLETLNFDLEQTRALLATLTAGNSIDLNVGGNLAAQVSSTDAAGKLQADRMTASGVIKGGERQQVSLTHTDDKAGTTTNGQTSKVLGNLAAQGIHSGANDSFAPESVQAGQTAVTALMQNGLLTIRNQPAVQAALNAPTSSGSALTYKDDSGRVTLTLAGEAKVQAVYNQLKLTETFDVKHFADQGTAQIVTLVSAIALTVCTGGAGAGTVGAALATAGSTSAMMINAAFIAMTSTMTGQLAGGASFDQAFQAGLKAGTTSAITAGILNAQVIDTAQGMQSINQLANVQTTGANIVGNFNADTLGQNLLGMGARGVVNAGVSTAINGGSFGNAFRSSVVGDLAAVGANAVGISTDVHSLENIGGHALVGCVAAAANGKDCASGAIGGAGAAIVNPLLDLAIGGADGSGWGADPETAQKWRFGTLQLATMATAAGLASATGKDGMTAALAAQNETVNNWLTPKEQELKWRASKACDAGNARGCQIGVLLSQLDASREATPSARFSSGFANALVLAGGGALLMPVEITKAVVEGRSVEFAIGVLKGIGGIPERLYKGLSSDDPAMRGAAFAESMMVVAGSATLARSFSQGLKGAGSTATGAMSAVDAEMVANNGAGAALQGVSAAERPFAFNAIENPGPLASLPGNPAANFFSGKYNQTVLTDDLVLYRGGEVGKPLGQWFTRELPPSVAEIRIDSAVKPQWIDPTTGVLTGNSIIDTVYAIRIPKGTTIYEGPVGYQGGIHLGGSSTNQIFVPTPWNLKGVQVLDATPIR